MGHGYGFTYGKFFWKVICTHTHTHTAFYAELLNLAR